MKHRVTLVAALLLAVACSSENAAPPADSGAAATTAAAAGDGASDLADITNYRLTMDKVDQYYAAQRNMMVAMKDMSPAEREALELENDNPSLDDMARSFESHPAIASAMRDAGLTGREFATITMSMVQSGMAAMALQMRPNDDQDSLAREMQANMANIKFMQENQAALERKQAELRAEMQRLGIGDENEDQDEG